MTPGFLDDIFDEDEERNREARESAKKAEDQRKAEVADDIEARNARIAALESPVKILRNEWEKAGEQFRSRGWAAVGRYFQTSGAKPDCIVGAALCINADTLNLSSSIEVESGYSLIAHPDNSDFETVRIWGFEAGHRTRREFGTYKPDELSSALARSTARDFTRWILEEASHL